MLSHAFEVDELNADHENNSGEHRFWHVLEWRSEEEEDDENDESGSDLRELTSTACPINHFGFCRASVHHKRSGETCKEICCAESDEVDVLIKLIVVFCGVGTGSRCALGEDQNKN